MVCRIDVCVLRTYSLGDAMTKKTYIVIEVTTNLTRIDKHKLVANSEQEAIEKFEAGIYKTLRTEFEGGLRSISIVESKD